MKLTAKKVTALLLALLLLVALFAFVASTLSSSSAYAAEETTEDGDTAIALAENKTKQVKGWAAAIIIAVVATAGAVTMGLAICKAIDGIARQPEAESKIRTTLMLGLVFIETAIIYALIVAILVVFVL